MATKEDLRQQWQTLQALDNLSSQERQRRGYQLEELIITLLAQEDLQPAPPYRTQGEQVDGLFEMEGRYFLLEVKWIAKPAPASEVYAFRAKVEGKLTGTIGTFIAVNGFSEDVPEVLRYGKEINVILFDGDDVTFALDDEYSLTEVLKAKLRRAAQYGEIYYNFSRHLDEQASRKLLENPTEGQ